MIKNLLVMLLELINTKKLTAQFLSKRLDVSTRTIYRYVDELNLANIPISTVKGRTGGIYIGEEYKLNCSIFNSEELEFIKNSILLNERNNNVRQIQDIISKFNVLSTSNTNLSHNNLLIESSSIEEQTIIEKINIFERAIVLKHEIKISYTNRNGEKSSRIINPYQLVLNQNNWYIYCYCTLRKEFRLFKLTRITNITSIDKEYVTREIYSKDWKLSFDDGKEQVKLLIRLSQQARYPMEEWLGIESINIDCTDNLTTSTTQYLDNDLLYKLLSFGDEIEIIEPVIVKEKLFEIVSNIANKYAVIKSHQNLDKIK